MNREYFVVDAFASEPFTGNPAAVLLDADGLDDVRMASIAAEFNLSETTFVLPPSEPEAADSGSDAPGLSVRFRWFTPTAEVDMCGHATIAGVHALVETGRIPVKGVGETSVVHIETRSGLLTAYVERIPGAESGRMIWLDLIDPILTPQDLSLDEFADALGLSAGVFDRSLPPIRSQDRDALVFVGDAAALNNARPDFARLMTLLERYDLRGLSLATTNTLTPSINVQSRFFAPTAGINEDAVTGSVHGPLAAYLVQQGSVPVHEGLAGLTCVQGIPDRRAGLVNALVQPLDGGGYAVRIGGRAITAMTGVIVV